MTDPTPIANSGSPLHVESPDCWCNPDVCMVCPECEEHEKTPPDCWKCEGHGLVPHDGSDAAKVTVHR